MYRALPSICKIIHFIIRFTIAINLSEEAAFAARIIFAIAAPVDVTKIPKKQ